VKAIDWIRTEDGEVRHPLQHRCFESAMKLWHQTDELGLDKSDDPELGSSSSSSKLTGVKLAGALDGLAMGQGYGDAAFTVAYLKRALDHLHKSQAGLEPWRRRTAPRATNHRGAEEVV